MPWTQYDVDLAPPYSELPPPVVILRQGNELTYTTFDGLAWGVFRLDIERGTCRHSQPFRCFIEAVKAHRENAITWSDGASAKRAHDAGAIIWED